MTSETSPDRLTAVVARPTRGRPHPAGRGRSGSAPRPAAAPDPVALARLLVRAASEVAAGRRPLRQLEPLVTPGLARRLAAQLRAGPPRSASRLEVRRVVCGAPTPTGAVELVVLVEREGRVTAIAVRLERHRGAWRATELTAPESGYPALLTASEPGPARHRPDAFDEVLAEAGDDDPPVLRLVGR